MPDGKLLMSLPFDQNKNGENKIAQHHRLREKENLQN